jgi:hypothetical protein
MHLLPRVAELEERFGEDLVVIGVHSGKYTAEHRTRNIRQACARLGVRHPVVNDRQFRIWRSYAVSAWPTVALVSPDGYLIGTQAGEFEVEPMANAISGLLDGFRGEGLLRSGALDFGADPEWPPEPDGVLRFPARVAAAGELLYVSDTGHHRVLELRLDGDSARVIRTFGDGADGFADGPAGTARFAEPQGLALRGETLYVADRRNHAVRAVSLRGGEVTTIAGDGRLGAYRIEPGPGRDTPLRSPWGLAIDGGVLYVTMAGSHQLWAVALDDGSHPLSLVAGSGAENITDGPGARAALAQPSGVVAAAGELFVADAESSAVRRVTLDRRAEVVTLAGEGLFEFGDRDGTGGEARLQHDLDVAAADGALLVCDTYNGKIKRLDPVSRTVETLPGDAGSGESLWEPGGIWAGPEGAFVADTNHHRLMRLDPVTGALTGIEVG